MSPQGGGGVMAWTGISYWQRTQLHFIDGNLNRDNLTRCWGPLSCHSSAAITSCFSMIMRSSMSKGSVHNSWNLKMSQFFHGLYAHQTCLGCSGSTCTTVFQFPPISSNFAQPLKRSGTTFHRPQSTAWSTLCDGDVSRCMRQMVVTPDTDWFSEPCPYFFLRYLWPTDAFLYSQSCEIHRLVPNEFI